MPHPGVIDADLIAACRAEIDLQFGPIPPGLGVDADSYRTKLAHCIARAAQYVRDNAIVNPGQTVSVPGVVLGTDTATGTVVTDGDLS